MSLIGVVGLGVIGTALQPVSNIADNLTSKKRKAKKKTSKKKSRKKSKTGRSK